MSHNRKKTKIRIELGKIIKAKRQLKNFSQEKLAELADLHPNYVGSIERGERNVSIENIFCISNALGCHASELFPCLEETHQPAFLTPQKIKMQRKYNVFSKILKSYQCYEKKPEYLNTKSEELRKHIEIQHKLFMEQFKLKMFHCVDEQQYEFIFNLTINFLMRSIFSVIDYPPKSMLNMEGIKEELKSIYEDIKLYIEKKD